MKMKLELLGKSWVARSTYDEREIPKGAGFRWNPAQRIWWTDEPRRAQKLAQYADEPARAAIEAALNVKKEAIEASRATNANIDIPVPDGLAYLPFQKAGIAYALNRPNVLFGDEMGLGKTVEAIGVINADESLKKILVVCPASLKLNWKREIEKWLTRPLSVGIINGQWQPQWDVVILNYDVLKKWHETIQATEFDLLIVDECHYIKNPKAQRTAYVLGRKEVPGIRARRKLFLTGTPIVNRPIELWPIAHAIDPKNFSSWKYYVLHYCDGGQTRWGWDVSGASHLDELQEKLRASFMVRRLKSEVLTELPPKRRQVIDLPANGAGKAIEAERSAWEAQQERLADLRAKVELAKASEDPADYEAAVTALRDGARAAFTEISKLRHETAVAKVPATIDFLHACLDDDGGKIVFFAHHHDVINAIQAEFSDTSVVLTGETPQADRQAAVDRFQDNPACKLFIGSITAAGVGITLTASSHVIFGELDWVPGNITQAEDRTHRIGQVNSVLVQHLVLDGSLDAQMARTLIEKQQVIDKALNERVEVDVVLPEPIKEDEKPATSRVTRKEIEKEAEAITPEEIEQIHERLKILAGVCDYAHQLDGAGFNKFDAPIGHALAEADRLTPRMAILGRKLVKKYHRQLT